MATYKLFRGAFFAPALVGVLLACSASQHAVADEPISIGMAVALTGFLANPDAQVIDGVKLAVGKMNAAGGVQGRRIDLHILDDASSATTGVTVTNQLLNQYGISAMINGLSSGQNAAIEPILERARVPMIIVSQLPPEPKWAFLATPTNEKFADLQLRFVDQKLHARKIAIVASQTPYGQIGSRLLSEGASKRGITVVDTEMVEGAVTDMTPQLAKIKEAAPDAVIDFLTGATHIVEAKGAATAGLQVPIVMAGDDLPTLRQAASSYPKLYFIASPAQAYPNIADPPQKEAYEALLNTYKATGAGAQSITSGMAFGWDAAIILKAAIEKAGSTGGDALHQALENLSVQGTSTLYRFTPSDHTGQRDTANTLQIGHIGERVEIVFP
jgi:branched-chain amino acid transport system substrate-binding protein